MNCKKCGHELSDQNITCPNCGNVNENYNNGSTVQIEPTTNVEVLNTEVPTTPEIPTQPNVVQTEPINQVNPITNNQPIEQTPINSNEPKKKNGGLIVIIVIVGLLLVGGGVFFGIKLLNPNNPNTNTTNNSNNNNNNEPELVYSENSLVIEKMTDKEVFNLVHETLTLTYEDGELRSSFIERMPATKLGITPFSSGTTSYDIHFGYIGFDKNGGRHDHIDEVKFSCKPDYDILNSDYPVKLYNLKEDRKTSITMRIFDDRGESLYKSFKKYYKEAYPEGEVTEELPSEDNLYYYKLDIKTADKHEVHIEYEEKENSVYRHFGVSESDKLN